MAVLAKISPILSALSQGMNNVSEVMSNRQGQNMSSSLGTSRGGAAAGLGGLNLGNYGEKLSLSNTMSNGNTGLGSLSTGNTLSSQIGNRPKTEYNKYT